MINKTLISSVIVISIIVGLVIMFTSGPRDIATDTSQQTNRAENSKLSVEKQTDIQQKRPIEKTTPVAKKPQTKVAKKPKTQKQSQSKTTTITTTTTTASSSSSSSRISRVSRPGMKYRIVRVEKAAIPPKSELRKWSRSQWVAKVSTLRDEGEESLAQDYITAYNAQYPDKDLNHFLK